MLQFNKMKQEEKSVCADLVAHSFYDYEYFTNYIPNDKKRLRFLKQLMRTDFAVNAGKAHYFTAKQDGKVVAVVMLCAPDYHKPSDMDYIKNGFLKCYLFGGYKDVNTWNEMDTAGGKPCHELRPDAWYISFINVDPDCKGQRIGSRMLAECIEPYVREKGGKEICLFTNSEINRKFYQKNGFQEFHEQYFEHNGHRMGSWSYVKGIK